MASLIFALAAVLFAGCGRMWFDGKDVATMDASPDATPTVRGPGSWTATPPSPLSPRGWCNAVWTGAEFAVYGGVVDDGYRATDTGARFDPAANQWRAMANSPRIRHTAAMVQVLDQLIYYGGGDGAAATDGGAHYQLATDSWGAISANTPGLRIYGASLAVDDQFFTWGGWNNGVNLNTGYLYNPVSDTWKEVSTINAPSPRSSMSAVWTGSRVIVWGGCDGYFPACEFKKSDGASYDPATDTWTSISSLGAPSPRDSHATVWTGSEMIVWGGASQKDANGPLGTGAIYNPATDTWRPMSMQGALTAMIDPAAVWMIDKMVVWGGFGDNFARIGDGALYDPLTDQWTAMATVDAPPPRVRFAFAANERQLLVWGGFTDDALNAGAIWTPE
jgi:N-acetylneuraminic acid mutarotase